jgi:GDP-L-fucose synthase
MELKGQIFVAGHRGLVGSAIVRNLEKRGFVNLLTRSRAELDLLDQKAVGDFFTSSRPEFVFLAAAKVGGIYANSVYPADFIFENLQIQLNVLQSAARSGVRKVLFLGSSCIYPKYASQPLEESSLLTGALEPTNEPYAVAKIAGIKMCEAYRRQYGCDFISAMPTNIYGPGDNYHPENSHVIPGLIHRFHEAKSAGHRAVRCWGTGSARREFLYADDLADACVFLMQEYSDSETINIGTGTDITIRELAGLIADVVGFSGDIEWDHGKPDGTPRKVLDVSRMNELGWTARTPLRVGLERTYSAFCSRMPAANI